MRRPERLPRGSRHFARPNALFFARSQDAPRHRGASADAAGADLGGCDLVALPRATPIVCASKGIENESLLTMNEVLEEVFLRGGCVAQPRSLLHPDEPQVAVSHRAGAQFVDLESDAVVPDRERHASFVLLQRHRDGPGARMERDVGERLLGDAEARRLDIRREPRVRRAGGESHPIAGALRMLLEQAAEGVNQPEVVEHRGPEVEREGLHFRDRLVDLVHAIVQQLRRRPGAEPPVEGLLVADATSPPNAPMAASG